VTNVTKHFNSDEHGRQMFLRILLTSDSVSLRTITEHFDDDEIQLDLRDNLGAGKYSVTIFPWRRC
jgi:hypothetical protein